eukprot:TRINITY_DN13150_c0_g2_i1.p1 TRINITY_DN13150_c0_g2~~TRINITY_DN13150_c0_g2_i1.p1  ORF type:complete len:276 (-),score=54.65 TRINITY_DN13150_c0_g2_i1:65-892(-)
MEQLARELPKSELHLHLDGSLSPQFLYDRAAARCINMPADNPEDLHRILRSADPDHRTLVLAAMPGFHPSGNNWLHFDFCNQFLQTSEELAIATASLVCNEYQEHNTRVVEIRFCPTLHCREGLTPDEVVEAVVRGFADGTLQATGESVGGRLVGGIIICALRSNPEEHGVEMAELAHRWLGRGVIGWDLAADEGAHPLQGHQKGVQTALQLGVPCTVHAGEWGSGPKTDQNQWLYTKEGHFDTLPNIELALELGVHRIGPVSYTHLTLPTKRIV